MDVRILLYYNMMTIPPEPLPCSMLVCDMSPSSRIHFHWSIRASHANVTSQFPLNVPLIRSKFQRSSLLVDHFSQQRSNEHVNRSQSAIPIPNWMIEKWMACSICCHRITYGPLVIIGTMCNFRIIRIIAVIVVAAIAPVTGVQGFHAKRSKQMFTSQF